MKNIQNIYSLQEIKNLNLERKKIGLLGGSFNPPHNGHLLISQKALSMGIDLVIWLVVPQNPLKPKYGLSLNERVSLASKLVSSHENIIISDLEKDIASYNSFDTITFLTSEFQNTDFIWLMGVDCLESFHLWENYERFPEMVDIIIFNRKGFENLIYDSIAAKVLQPKTCDIYKSGVIFVSEKLSDLSSTQIRELKSIR